MEDGLEYIPMVLVRVSATTGGLIQDAGGT